MVAVSANDDLRSTLLMPGIGLLGASVGILLPSLAIYIFEISTKEMRGKAILLLGIGFIAGSLLGGVFATVKQLGWIWQTFAACIIIALVTPVVNVFPESPYWVLERKGWDACEACLVVLRRKPDVQEELKIMRDEESSDEGASGPFKFLIGVFLMLVTSLCNGFLNAFVSYKGASEYTDQDQLFVNGMALQISGAVIAFFFVDKLDHKSILFGTLIPIAICAGVLGFNETSEFLADTEGSGLYVSLVVMLMYFFIGLGISSAPWAACVGMFTTRGRAVSTVMLFGLFFLADLGYVYLHTHDSLMSKEYMYLYALAGFCVAALVLILGAGTKKNGIICSKAEAERDRERMARRRAERESRRGPNTARGRNLSRVRSKSNAQRGNATPGAYQMYETPANAAPPLMHARP
ncbi:1,3-beta-glucan synthase component [Phytophthora boehmeriae]|uniref:1,3-beta-glucan synthase component n=1 Tax=Phytophthora boehmeriae TaxID=109152 RepID=A0A8T1WVN5_9STRA|nr:1,3-beta-glucan synthase component [Phytophthora boehmeriae]